MISNISRPARGLLPLALGLCAFFLPDRAGDALALMAALLLARGLSLCAGAALRTAAGGMVRASRLRGNLLIAIIMTLLGSAAAVALCATVFYADIGLWYAITGALIAFAQLCADRMYVSPDSRSAMMYDVITTLLAATGFLISDTPGWLTSILPLGGAVAGTFLLAGLKTGNSVKAGFKIFKHIPMAFLRSWLIPAALVTGAHFHGGTVSTLAAIGIFEALTPAFRRSDAESHSTGAFIGIAATLWTAVCCFGMTQAEALPAEHALLSWLSWADMLPIIIALLGAALTGLHLDLRRILGCAVILGMALLPILPDMDIYGPAGLCTVCLGLWAPEFRAILRHMNAKRIQIKRSH